MPCATACTAPKPTEQNVGERAVHRLTHDDGKDQTGGAVERAGDDQELVIERETHGAGGKSGVGIQQRDDGGHVGAADRHDEENAESQRQDHENRIELRLLRIENQVNAHCDRRGQHCHIDEELAFISDRAAGQHFLQFAPRHDARRDGHEAQQRFDYQRAHDEAVVRMEFCNTRRFLIKADARAPQACEIVRVQRRHAGHRHEDRDGRADNCAEHDADGDPFVIENLRAQKSADYSEQHARFSGEDAAARGGGRTHPLDGEDEAGSSQNVEELVKAHFPAGSRFLNILSMRSVIM